MKYVDPALLKEFRAASRCERCGKGTSSGCDPHHLIRRGTGGGTRLDLRCNLIAICFVCHAKTHGGHIQHEEFILIVARREKIDPEDLKSLLAFLVRAPKGLVLPLKAPTPTLWAAVKPLAEKTNAALTHASGDMYYGQDDADHDLPSAGDAETALGNEGIDGHSGSRANPPSDQVEHGAEEASKEAETMKYHPVCDLFPRLAGENLAAMRADMEANGIRVSILVWCDQIMDGRHRWEIAKELGIRCPIHELKCDENEAISRAVSANLHRRHLTASQRAMMGAKLIDLYAPNAEKRSRTGTSVSDDTEVRSRESAAKDAGSSPASVARAKKVLDKAEPEVIEAVNAGEATVADAAAIADKPAKVQRKAVKAKQAGKAKTLKAAAEAPPSEDNPIFDRCGRPIPTQAIPAYLDLPAIDAWVDKLGSLRNWLKTFFESEPRCFNALDVNIQEAVRNSISLLKTCRFYAACVYCFHLHGEIKDDCKACRGFGWVTRGTFDSAPPEYRELAK